MALKVTRISPVTGKENTLLLDITKEQCSAYHEGALIQDAFPNLTASEREFIMTGLTEEDWCNMFGTEE